jgi:molybdopterin-guanine dinucleotide biosynthesis protein A
VIPLYILAGGRSSRFGSDKARALVAGVPSVVRVADALAPVAAPATVVAAAAGAYDDLGLPTIGDLEPGRGPLGGLVTALRDAAGPVFVAACDLTEPRAEWAQALIAAGGTAAFRTARGWEPLFGRYDMGVLSVADRLLGDGERSVQVLLDEVAAVALKPPDGWPEESSFNTPEGLSR